MNESKPIPFSELADTSPPPPRRASVYSTFLPFLIVLVTLVLSSTKDVVTLLQRKASLRQARMQMAQPLIEAGKQAEFVMSLRDDLVKLSATDPVAARIVIDMFPSTARQAGMGTDTKPASN